MPEVRGIMIDFFNERPYYYPARNHAETRALHKIYEVLKDSDHAPKPAITSIAHIDDGESSVLLKALAEMLAAVLVNTDKPEIVECLFITAMYEALRNQRRDSAKKNPLK